MRTADDLVADARERIREVSAVHLTDPTRISPLLIDVREPSEFLEGHIPGSINLPRGLLEFKIHSHLAPADGSAGKLTSSATTPMLVYCQTGGRAALAADSLQQLGFREVRSLAGGFAAWKEAGLPVSVD
ncbi:rhodanese-like domain-containing protein [Stenotrophomonas maltophilia]|uniref:rhodanese-like domain-containing protein n=1 Tax=Stenotrophomonas maltophilia TaxID=40324 RepID=UPI001F52FDF8|nr:rhodanese-like domain-containing protein [Stenotrophomonas maltophilia]MCI1058794.1 sulfurtransferase [Stenotrophomonas maltophilia]MCI1062261.1 sulfurtransferase [Stenotrophomonas maltophilia]MCI1079776.1 sulfurtransferase [Stenotrophomonas maltophilia]MCI1082925.1 sulfurtransferase [Stenotrophomonas maltophilia]MCI1095248.1 sulfurtransferase [Stenotrophomonas maltophilia]